MDRRSAKTKRAIRESFLLLLKDKNINQITVAEISRKADLGRGTFYLHYKDVFDLYSCIENDLYSELEKLFDNAYPSTDPVNLLNLTNTLTEYFESNREIFLRLVRPENNGITLHKLKTMFTNKVMLEESGLSVSEYDAVESMFIVSGVIGVLEEWIMKGLDLPQKQIADILHKIILKFGTSENNEICQ